MYTKLPWWLLQVSKIVCTSLFTYLNDRSFKWQLKNIRLNWYWLYFQANNWDTLKSGKPQPIWATLYIRKCHMPVIGIPEGKEKMRPTEFLNVLWEAENFPKLVQVPNHRSKKLRKHQVGCIGKINHSNKQDTSHQAYHIAEDQMQSIVCIPKAWKHFFHWSPHGLLNSSYRFCL